MSDNLNKNRFGFFLVSIVSIGFILSIIYNIKNDRTQVTEEKLVTLPKLVLASDSKVREITGRGARRWIELYPRYKSTILTVESTVYECSSGKYIVSDFKKDSVISVAVLKSDLYKLEMPDTQRVNIYQLLKGSYSYISKDCFNSSLKNEALIALFLCAIVGLFSFYASVRKTGMLIMGENIKPLGLFLFLVAIFALSLASTYW